MILLIIPLHPIELLRRLRVCLCVLSSNRQAHRMSATDVAANHPLVRNVLAHLPSQFRLDLQLQQWVLLIHL